MKKRHKETGGATTGRARALQCREEKTIPSLDWLVKLIESFALNTAQAGLIGLDDPFGTDCSD
jgi:hypothetical protein